MLREDHAPLLRPLPALLPWQSYFLAFALGLFSFKNPTPAAIAVGVLIVADTAIRGWSRRLPVLAFALCAAFGFGYASQRAPEPAATPEWMELRQPVDVTATVDSVEPKQGGRLLLTLKDAAYTYADGKGELPGKVSWNWREPDYEPEPGQTVSLRMRVMPLRSFGNPGGWDYEWYWQRQGVNWRAWPDGKDSEIVWGKPSGALWAGLKHTLRRAVAAHIPDTQGGAMVLALVTGDRSRLDDVTMDEARSSGLAHTLALSGLHVGFVAFMGAWLAWILGWIYPPLLLRIPRPKLAVLTAAPLVLGYAWLGQPSPSLLRAATMFAFWGFLLLQGRGRVLMDGLFFALAVILFVSPLSIYDLSLQMSAVAVAGIGVMFPSVNRLCRFGHAWWQRGLGWAAGLLGLSLCVNIALLPLVSWNFGTFTPNILLNLVWLPALGLAVMPLGIAGLLLSCFAWTAPLGAIFLSGAAGVMDGLLFLLHSIQAWAPVIQVLRPLWLEILGGAVLLVTALLALINRRLLVGLAGVGFALLVWPHVGVMLTDAQDQVSVSLLDVGQGQAALISTPGGHRWLVDAGAGSNSFDYGESVVAPYLTYGRPPRLDGIFMSHPDVDHSHGVPFILSSFEVGTFFSNGMTPRGTTGKRLQAVLARRGIEPIILMAGQTVELGGDTRLEILHPADGFRSRRANERSLVMRLMRGNDPLALLPGDVEQEGINAMLATVRDMRAEVLVLPHHGSRSSYSPPWYEAIAPKVVLCSSGYINMYGFPHGEVVRGVGVPVYTTARHGMLTAQWARGGQLFVNAFRP